MRFGLNSLSRNRRNQHKKKNDKHSCFPCLYPTTAVAVPPPRRGGYLHDSAQKRFKRKAGCNEEATRTRKKVKIEYEYLIGPELGRGNFGVVRLCKNLATGVCMACKTISKKGAESPHYELQIMQHFSGHPNVVTLHDVYEDADFLHLVMEFCSGGSLADSIARNKSQFGCYSEFQAANYMKELVTVIKYCHQMRVVHRDIKPENILLSGDGHLKLADFGLSMHVAKGQRLSELVGTPEYIAPEMFSGIYTAKVDVWAAGIVLHVFLTGMLPFHGKSVEAIFQTIQNYVHLDFQTQKWELVSGLAKDLLSRMLSRDVEKRLSPDEVLSHPWIRFYTESETRPENMSLSHRPERIQDGASLVPRMEAEDGQDSISRHLQRMLHINAASCRSPSFPGHKDSMQDKASLVHEENTEDGVDSISSHLQSMLHVNASGRMHSPFAGQSNLDNHKQGGFDAVDVLSAAMSKITVSRIKRSRVLTPAYASPPVFLPNFQMPYSKAC